MDKDTGKEAGTGSILRKYFHSQVTVPDGALEYNFESYKKKEK